MLSRLARLAGSLCLCFAFVLASAPPAGATRLDPREPDLTDLFPSVEISAKSAVVIDDATGVVVYAKQAHARRAPASITKIMTALVALKYDYPTRVVTSHVDWWDLSDSTLMGIYRGARLSIEDLIYGMMLPSGNDAALAIARAVAGSDANFVALMNAEAQRMGLQDTHFMNPHGLDEEGHYTSAYDIAQIARYAMRSPEFARIVATRQIELVSLGPGRYPVKNINKFPLFYPGADGVKHGYTDDAGQTLVGTAVRNGKRAYVALLGSWNYVGDATVLMDAYFATWGDRAVPATGFYRTFGVPSTLPETDQPPHQWIDVPPSHSGYVKPVMRAQ